MSDHDAVVVGSGPGGAVTARALAEAGLDVLVVEEGPRVEAGSVVPFSLDQMHRQYRNAGLTVALGSPSVAYAEGRCVGGGSEVNSGLYHRADAALLDAWSRSHRIEGLDTVALEPWQRLVEERLSVAPWPDTTLPAASAALRRGAEALGWRGLDVPRWARYEHTGGGVRVDRQTMTRTYLPAAEAAGVRVRSGVRACRVEREGRRAVGVRLRTGDGEEVVRAEHVFVCAGSTQTPALLQRSGWRGRVGRGLSVHPTVKAVADFDEPVNPGDDVATYQVKEFGSWLSLGGSASTPAMVTTALADAWEEFGDAAGRWPHQAVYYAAIQSRGTGWVRAVPGFADPMVTYRLDADDRRRLTSGLARLLHVLLAAGARTVYPSFRGATAVTDSASAAEAMSRFAVGRASVMSVHLTGTVAMGEDRRRAAADSVGRLHGAENLVVNDASLLPWAPGINPQGTVMALAHRNAAAFLERAGA